MAQDLLHVSYIGPAVQQQRRHAVPEQVAAPGLAEASRLHQKSNPLGKAVEPEAPATPREEQKARVG